MSRHKRTREYEIFDVFTTDAFCGNSMAIVHESDGLNTAQMIAIAREFNLSETVFVLAPQNPLCRAFIRIFKPDGETPFAGHPTIGAAISLALRQGTKNDLLMTVEEKIGPVRCVVNFGEETLYAEFDLPKQPARRTMSLESEVFAAAFGLENSNIGFDNHVPCLWDAGVPYFFVPVRHLTAVAAVSPDPLYISQNFAKIEGRIPSFYFYCQEAQRFESAFHARMFRHDGSEDAATGSAASAFIGVMQHFNHWPDGYRQVWLEQGFEMGRPSRIRLAWSVENGILVSARIGGNAVRVARGELLC